MQQIRLSDNLADLFTKSLSTSTFKKLIHMIGMRQLKNIDMRGSMLVKGVSVLYSFFIRPGFILLGFIGKVFNETVLTYQEKNIVLFFFARFFL